MKTDDLIRALASDLAPQPAVTRGLWRGLGAALVLCVALVGLVLGFRGDLGASLLVPVSGLRFVLAIGLFAAALRLALPLTRPDATRLASFAPLAALAGVAGLAVIWALISTPMADWGRATLGSTAVWCLVSIPVLSVAPVAVLLAVLRRGATAQPRLLGGLAGLAGAGLAAAAYALHCAEDNPLFYVTWYGLAIALVTLVSAGIGARLLHW